MARTVKQKPRRPMSREKTWARRMTTREHRAQCAQAVREARYDDVPRFRGTCGWVSW
jgi:hypothetical protein